MPVHKLLFTSLLMLMVACTSQQSLDREMYIKATNIANKLNINSINTFKKWGFFSRGELVVWMKLNDTGVVYSFNYLQIADTIRLSRILSDEFKKDFTSNLLIDSSKYYNITMYKSGNLITHINLSDMTGRDCLLSKNIPLKKVFPINDPFATFKSLTDLKESLGIWSSFYNPRLGNFVEFHLSSQYTVYYIPDDLYIDSEVKNLWLSTFSHGKKIKKNWVLIKRNTPD